MASLQVSLSLMCNRNQDKLRQAFLSVIFTDSIPVLLFPWICQWITSEFSKK